MNGALRDRSARREAIRAGVPHLTVLDHDNLIAVSWSALYCFSLVLLVSAFNSVGIKPTVTVPLVIVVLPFVVGAVITALDRIFLQDDDDAPTLGGGCG